MENEEKSDLKNVRTSTIAFCLAGIAMGAVSFFLNFDILSLALGFALLIVLAAAMKKHLKKKAKFFLGDVLAYLLIWLAAWIFLFNM